VNREESTRPLGGVSLVVVGALGSVPSLDTAESQEGHLFQPPRSFYYLRPKVLVENGQYTGLCTLLLHT